MVRYTADRSDAGVRSEDGRVHTPIPQSGLLFFSNVCRQLIAATSRLQELLKGLLNIPLLMMRCS